VRLLRAAHADLRATRLLAADPDQANEIVGFHAQQTVEKAIKAVLVASGAEIPYTHDLSLLLDILATHDIKGTTSRGAGGLAHPVGRGRKIWGF
jgi:HEPN domain-containing protein